MKCPKCDAEVNTLYGWREPEVDGRCGKCCDEEWAQEMKGGLVGCLVIALLIALLVTYNLVF